MSDHENDSNQTEGFVPDGEVVDDGAEIAASAGEGPSESETIGAPVGDAITAAKISELEELASERTADLQRLQAEYVNYKRRVDRDRALAKASGIEAVTADLLPVLDSIEAAKAHGELTGGFKLVADELEKVAAKYGLILFGEPGEEFDPQIHEALMQMPYEGEHDTTVLAAVMQRGAKLGDRVIRPARVGVADPQ